MKVHTIGIIMNGVTGRMGRNQHLFRSILPIIRQGGVRLSDEEVIVPRPILVGRSPDRLEALARESGVDEWTTDLDAVLADPSYPIYFDAQRTDLRMESVARAIAAGKHIYCEKPTALTTEDALELYRLAAAAGVKHGVVQDKLWLPGLVKLRRLRDQGFFGRIFCVKADFGYWVFEGDTIPAQRPSWNYRKEDGGGIVLDMFCHWRYVLDNLFGEVESVACAAVVHIDRRYEPDGTPYDATAEDAAYAIFELSGGIIAQINSSWNTRVRRDDLLTIQVDGTRGSAVAGLRDVWVQPYGATPKPVWNPDIPHDHSFFDDWLRVPDQETYDNAFKVQWELFLRHVVRGDPFPWDLLAGAKGVQLAELGTEAAQTKRWVPVPPLTPEIVLGRRGASAEVGR